MDVNLQPVALQAFIQANWVALIDAVATSPRSSPWEWCFAVEA
jgi:hypothetical protein